MITLIERDNDFVLKESLKKVPFNTLFARAVVEQHVTGRVYADHFEHPQTVYIVHPYGMSLLLGNPHNNKFNQQFRGYVLNKDKARSKPEWMQAYPNEWYDELKELFKNELIKADTPLQLSPISQIEQHTRLNFRFNHAKYLQTKFLLQDGARVVPLNGRIFNTMRGAVIPKFFWNNADDFLQRGAGFSVLKGDKLACTAYSAFVVDHFFELGIETLPEYQGRGFAQAACAVLIDFCLKKGYEPVWACRKGNTGSIYLAEKLGFEVSMETPFYFLPV